jgi:hypothetical protein
MHKTFTKHYLLALFTVLLVAFYGNGVQAQGARPKFKVIAFYTGKSDLAHISFVHEANRWFPQTGTI